MGIAWRAARLLRVARRDLATIRALLEGHRTDVEAPARGESYAPVLIVTTLRRLGAAGVNTHITEVVDVLKRRGHHADVVSLDSWLPLVGPLLLGPSWLIRRMRWTRAFPVDRYLTRLSLELSIRNRMRVSPPRAIYAQDPSSAYAALKARGRAKIPVILAVHFNESEAQELVGRCMIRSGSRQERTIRTFEARVISRVDRLIFVSEFMRRHLTAALPAASAVPTSIIPNFLSAVEPSTSRTVRERRDCITIGHLGERKNHQFLLHVLAAARRRGRDLTLTIVGDGPERGALEQLATELAVCDLVTFAGQRSDVAVLLPQHKVYVHSSLMENCPFAILEAFQAGLPVLTSAVGGIPEVVGEDEGAGRFWDLTDPEHAALALIEMVDSPQYLRTAGASARRRYEERYDAAGVGNKLAEVLTGTSARLEPDRRWRRR